MPAENDPADPNALTQSLQLTCSLTPSSTEPSTRLVIIWLKRCLATSVIELPLEPLGQGGRAVANGNAATSATPTDVDVEMGVEVGVEHEVEVDCANATPGSPPRSNS